MKQRNNIAISVLILTLSASCDRADEKDGTAKEEAQTASALRQPSTSSDRDHYELRKNCGGIEVIIRCRPKDIECKKTALSAKADGKSVNIASPAELEDYTAIGVGCGYANNGRTYVILQYGELPYGCKYCEWFHLYDDSLNLLTRSRPLVMYDNAQPDSWRRYPNNEEFNALAEKLGISETNVELFNGPSN